MERCGQTRALEGWRRAGRTGGSRRPRFPAEAARQIAGPFLSREGRQQETQQGRELEMAWLRAQSPLPRVT